MNAAPKQIMHRYLDRALQHFVELLSPARRSTTVSAHSTSSMLKVGQHSQTCYSVHLPPCNVTNSLLLMASSALCSCLLAYLFALIESLAGNALHASLSVPQQKYPHYLQQWEALLQGCSLLWHKSVTSVHMFITIA